MQVVCRNIYWVFEPELRRDAEIQIWKSSTQGITDAMNRDIIFQGSCVKWEENPSSACFSTVFPSFFHCPITKFPGP